MLEDATKVGPLEVEVKDKVVTKKKLIKEAIVAKIEAMPRHVSQHPSGHPARK